MRAQPDTPQNTSFAVTPALRSHTPWRVSDVEVLPDYRLRVRFIDGLEGFVDMRALVHAVGAGVFAPLVDPKRFAQATIVYGSVTWPDEIDLAPDAMYAAIKACGEWVLA